MNNERIAATARQWISSFDTGAHGAIAAWRTGGDRLGAWSRARWDAAFAESKPQLSEETQVNADKAREAFAGCYARGVDLAATGAETAVDALVQAARTGVERAAGWRAA